MVVPTKLLSTGCSQSADSCAVITQTGRIMLSSFDKVIHLCVFRKSAKIFLRKQQFPVNGKLENTPAPGNEDKVLNFIRIFCQYPLRQTGGSWKVVSLLAVFQLNFHGVLLTNNVRLTS